MKETLIQNYSKLLGITFFFYCPSAWIQLRLFYACFRVYLTTRLHNFTGSLCTRIYFIDANSDYWMWKSIPHSPPCEQSPFQARVFYQRPGNSRVQLSILAVSQTMLLQTEISHVVSRICWSHSPSLRVTVLNTPMTTSTHVALTPKI